MGLLTPYWWRICLALVFVCGSIHSQTSLAGLERHHQERPSHTCDLCQHGQAPVIAGDGMVELPRPELLEWRNTVPRRTGGQEPFVALAASRAPPASSQA